MKQIYVGTFQCGHENVDLYALPDEDGGSFYGCPDAKSCARMKVGIKYRHWGPVPCGVAARDDGTCDGADGSSVRSCRESYRGSCKLPVRFRSRPLHQAVGRTAMFMAEAVPKLLPIYQKYQRKRK